MAKLYSILDTKGSMYGPVMSFQNDQTAVRSFTEMLISGDKNSMLALYPTDYILFCIADFDQSNGNINSLGPVSVISGLEAITRAVEESKRRRALSAALHGRPSTPAISDSSVVPEESVFSGNDSFVPGDQNHNDG